MHIEGRRIFVNQRARSQTVKVCTSENRQGEYEAYYRLDSENAVKDSEISSKRTLSELREWLLGHGAVDEGPKSRNSELAVLNTDRSATGAGIGGEQERAAMTTVEQSKVDAKKVFVIHGRNEPARKGLFAFLRSIGLEPIEWSQAIGMTGKGSPYIGEVLNVAFGAAQAVVVLQTPDDVAHLHESLTYPGDPETSPQMQPRPNVLFEAGMALARDEDRTIIVELGHIKSFSDIHGRHVVRLNNGSRSRQDLAQRLRTAGCAVNLDGADWHEEGDLTPPASPGGGLPLGRKLPSSHASGQPRMEVVMRQGGKNSQELVITNHGPGDVYELDFSLPEDAAATSGWREEGFPVPKLPPGKSVKAARVLTLASSRPAYFTVRLTGKTADGVNIEQEEFVSGR